jgi:hypothetical protein
MKSYSDEKAEDSPLLTRKGKVKSAGLLVGKKPIATKFAAIKDSALPRKSKM